MQQSSPLFVDGARAFFFRSSRRFSCFLDFANLQGSIAWTTLARTSFIFLRAGLGRSVKHSTSGGRDMVDWGWFRIIRKPACPHFRSCDGSAPPIFAVVTRGAENKRLQLCVAFVPAKVAAFR